MKNKEWLIVYTQPQVLAIVLLNFTCGLPIMLTAASMSMWLKELGVSIESIGLFALTSLPYTLKFLWAPFVDQIRIPFLTEKFGRRRSWLIFTQTILLSLIFLVSYLPPSGQLMMTASVCLGISFFNALQEIITLALQMEILRNLNGSQNNYGAGEAAGVLGYRVGMLVAGAGALYLASFFEWTLTYQVMACTVLIGLITSFSITEPELEKDQEIIRSEKRSFKNFVKFFGLSSSNKTLYTLFRAGISPFLDFMKHTNWYWILIFMVVYRLGDYLNGTMSALMYRDIGFTKIDIANATKIFGMATTIFGGIIGGALLKRVELFKGLIICAICHSLGNLMFIAQVLAGNDFAMLYLTIGIEHISRGMAIVALFSYQMTLVNVQYSATQLALLTSFTAMGRVFFSSVSGILADYLGWVGFFTFTTFASLPGIMIGCILMKRYSTSTKTSSFESKNVLL